MANIEMKDNKESYFGTLPSVPVGGFSREQLKTHPKAREIVNIIHQVEKDIRKKASQIFEEFNVEFKFTATDSSKYSNNIVNAISFNNGNDSNKSNLVVPISFNFSKLGKLPKVEAYSVVYAVMYNSLLKKKDVSRGGQEYSFGKNLGSQPAVNDMHVDRAGNYVETRDNILDYIKKILKILLGDELGHDEIQDLVENSSCARDVTNNLKALGETEEIMFDNPKGQNLLAERVAKVVKHGYMQQATHLLGEISKSEFESLKTNDANNIKNFCEKYARVTLENCNIASADVQITFEASGDIGSYWDYGTYQKVNINIAEIMKIKNPAEVVMTLTHELKHAIDSTANKREGKTTQEGYGLLNNLIGDPSKDLDKIKKGTEAHQLLKEINLVCYRVNPNERSARLAELGAIKFIQGMQPDKSTQRVIDDAISTYETYQNSVISSIQSVETYRERYMQIRDGLAEGEKKLFDERFAYLGKLKDMKMLDSEQEKETIRIALEAKDKIKNSEGLQIDGSQLGDGV